MKKNRSFKNNIKTRDFLKSNELPKRYDLIISTMPNKYKSNFRIEYDNTEKVILFINKNTKDLGYLMRCNERIRSISFDNWDSSNVTHLHFAFEGLKLDKFMDFSKQDFSNLKSLHCAFSSLETKGNIKFENYTLQKLENAKALFSDVKCDNINVNLYNTSLINIDMALGYIRCNNLNFSVESTSDNVSSFQIIAGTKAKKVNLKNFNVSKVIDIRDAIRNTNINELIMPDTLPIEIDIGKISSDIQTIYCNKKWAEILNH